MKRVLIISSCILIMLAVHSNIWAQNILQDTLTWNATKATRQSDNNEIVYSSVFRTNGSESIDWIQKGGARVYHYSIDNASGTWENVSQGGQMVFHGSCDNANADLTFSRQDSGIQIHLVTKINATVDLDYVFYIDTISNTGQP